MRDKVQTSLWLDRDAKMLVMTEKINLSKFVNDHIYICLSVDNEAEILEKIKEHEMSIKALNGRLESLRSRKASESAGDSAAEQALAELRESFSVRMETERSREENLSWILSPRNIGRCKLLKKTSEQMLDELEAWNDGKETS